MRSGGATPFVRLSSAPTIVLASILVVVIGVAPGLVWALTRTP
jgi:hypothetical protein